jgi:hypothetical protein
VVETSGLEKRRLCCTLHEITGIFQKIENEDKKDEEK